MSNHPRPGAIQALLGNAKVTQALQATRGPLRAAERSNGSSTATLWLYGTIGSYWSGLDAASFAAQIRDLEVDELHVRVHSPGGSVFDGLAILNALRNHEARVVVTVDGLAASAASFIAMAGDEILMSPGSQMMIHDAWMLAVGDAADLRSEADWLDKQSANLATVYAARAGGTAAEWREAMQAETWYTADEAVTAGLADRVLGSQEEDEDPDTDVAAHAFDLSLFNYAGREHAPAPSVAQATPRLPAASAGGSTPTEGGSAVDFTTEQITDMRRVLGLAETADEATIVAALSEALDERADAPPTTTPAVPEGMALVEAGVLEELRQGAAAGRAAQETLADQARDRALDAAVTSGRITPARREHFAALYTADPEGTTSLLAALEPGLAVPTAELGHDNPVAENTNEGDAVYAELFPDENKGA